MSLTRSHAICRGLRPLLATLILALAAAPAQASDATDETRAILLELRDFPPWLQGGIAGGIGSEGRRYALYERLRQLGSDALPVLSQALNHPDARIRCQAAIALYILALHPFAAADAQVDISASLPDLITALSDEEEWVRTYAAEAIGFLVRREVTELPPLSVMLRNVDTQRRIRPCIVLAQLGHPAFMQLFSRQDGACHFMESTRDRWMPRPTTLAQ